MCRSVAGVFINYPPSAPFSLLSPLLFKSSSFYFSPIAPLRGALSDNKGIPRPGFEEGEGVGRPELAGD